MRWIRYNMLIGVMWMMVVGAAVAQTDTITLEPARDATLYEQGGSNPNGGEVANSGGLYLFTGETLRYGARRALLYFDIAGNLPSDAAVTSATLSLTLVQWIDNDPTGNPLNINRQVHLHALSTAWGAGTAGVGETGLGGGGYAATAGDATWTDAMFGTNNWQTEGGDFDPDPHATDLIWPRIKDRAFVWSEPAMVTDVNAWLLNPDENHGWILIASEDELQSALRFYAAEIETADFRPQLTLTYDAGPPPPATSVTLSMQPNLAVSSSIWIVIAATTVLMTVPVRLRHW